MPNETESANFFSKCRIAIRTTVLIIITATCLYSVFLFYPAQDAYKVDSFQKAGSVNLSVPMVVSWEKFISTLQPKFSLNADEALQKIIPKTSVTEEKISNAIAVKLSGENDEIKTGAAPSDNSESGNAPGADSLDKYGISEEPMLEYTAAAALYQEVQLLNHYVEDAALKYGYKAYIVRIQLGVLPYARKLPYDVFTTLSFFPFQYFDDLDEQSKTELEKFTKKRDWLDTNDEDNAENTASSRSKYEAWWYKAYVLPLLVTDDMESTLKSRSVERIRQLSMTLGLLNNSAVNNAGLDSLKKGFDKNIGTDLNSLLTVSRQSDNSIQVRLGAPVHPTAGYAMVPRTHYITTVVMVPKNMFNPEKKNPQMKLVSKSVFRDCFTGEALASQPRYMEREKIIAMLKTYEPMFENYLKSRLGGENDTSAENANTIVETTVQNLYYALFNNDYPRFVKTLKHWFPECIKSRPREIWLNFNEILLQDEYNGITFDIPAPPVYILPAKNQSVLLMDNGESSMNCALYGGKNLNLSKLSAAIFFTAGEAITDHDKEDCNDIENAPEPGNSTPPDKSAKKPDMPHIISFMAKTVETDAKGGNPVFSFPSPAAWKISIMKTRAGILKDGRLVVSYDNSDPWNAPSPPLDGVTYAPVLYQLKKP